MGLLKYLFLILILIFPLGEVARIQLGNNIAVTVNDIFLIVVAGVWIFLKVRNKKKELNKNFLKPFLIFIALCVLSLIVNLGLLSFVQLSVAFLYLLRWILYILLFFITSDFDLNFKKKIPQFLIIAGTITVILGYVQYFFYPNLRNLYYLGWDDHLYRMFSTFLDPNFAGAFFVLNFILVTKFFIDYLRSKNYRFSLLFFVLSTLSLGSIFLTFSRSAFLMLIGSSFVLLILEKKLKWIVLLLIISLVVFTASSKNFYIENLNLFRIASSEARLESVNNALKIIKDKPLTGVGFNAYRYAQVRYGFRNIEGSSLSHADAGTDNSFLFILATTGVFGFLAFLYLLFKILSVSLKESKKEKSSLNKTISIIIFSALIGIIINSFFINSLFYVFVMEWMLILLGVGSLKSSEPSK